MPGGLGSWWKEDPIYQLIVLRADDTPSSSVGCRIRRRHARRAPYADMDDAYRFDRRTAILMKEILSAGLNVYVMHTNFDYAAGGVNDALCELLGLSDCESMTLGAIGTCALPLSGIAERIGGNLRIWGIFQHAGGSRSWPAANLIRNIYQRRTGSRPMRFSLPK